MNKQQNTYLIAIILSVTIVVPCQGQPLKVGVAGLAHDHVNNIMHQYKTGQVIIMGIAEQDSKLVAKYKQRFGIPDSLFFPDLVGMLNHTKPDVVLAYGPINDHIKVVEACAPRGISVMVEKPLATTMQDALRMASLARANNVYVLTNYETTWYGSNQQIFQMVRQGQIGNVIRMVTHDGHQGPVEIGCSPEFLRWLTDPVKNGGGALMDFGCYGANLMTWLMNGREPVSVFAVTKHIKPTIYKKVDDDATIVLEYPESTGIIEASWNWPFGIKDFEVFGKSGYLHALNAGTLQQKDSGDIHPVAVAPYEYKDNIEYLTAILKKGLKPGDDPSSLNNNLIVMKILAAARKSAATGAKIHLTDN